MRRCGRRFKKLMDNFNEKRGFSNLKVEALDPTLRRRGLGRGYGPVVRQINLLRPTGHVMHQQFNIQQL
jgi:hypothetical protein